jgi:hypothetical protein
MYITSTVTSVYTPWVMELIPRCLFGSSLRLPKQWVGGKDPVSQLRNLSGTWDIMVTATRTTFNITSGLVGDLLGPSVDRYKIETLGRNLFATTYPANIAPRRQEQSQALDHVFTRSLLRHDTVLYVARFKET